MGDHISIYGKVGEVTGLKDSNQAKTGLVVALNSLKVCERVIGIKAESGHIDLTNAVVDGDGEIIILATSTNVKVSNPNGVSVHAHTALKATSDTLNANTGNLQNIGVTWDYPENSEQAELSDVKHHNDNSWSYDNAVVAAKAKAMSTESALIEIYRESVSVADYSDLQTALDEALDGDVIQVNANIELVNGLHFENKRLTIRGKDDTITITRRVDGDGNTFAEGMITVGGNSSANRTAPCSLTLESIIFDEEGKKGVVAYDEHLDTTTWSWVQTGQTKHAGIIELYEIGEAESDDVLITVTLGDKAILRNFGGYTAICSHYSGGNYTSKIHANIIMKSGSIIEDTIEDLNHEGGTAIGNGYITKLTMEEGSEIRNLYGASAYDTNNFDQKVVGNTSYNSGVQVLINGKIHDLISGSYSLHLIDATRNGRHNIEIGETGEIYNNSFTTTNYSILAVDGHATSTVIINGSIYDNTSAYKGGSLSVRNNLAGATVTIGATAKIYNNTANRVTGGIFMAQGTLNIVEGAQIYGNTATSTENEEGVLTIGKSGKTVTVNISGGTLIGPEGHTNAIKWIGGTITKNITGGTFSSDISSDLSEGYECVNNDDGTWTVQVKAN